MAEVKGELFLAEAEFVLDKLFLAEFELFLAEAELILGEVIG